MAEKILFPDSPPARWVFERDCVWFPAVRGAARFSCLATDELLMEHFGVRGPITEAEAMRAYEVHRPQLQAIARAQILAGNVSRRTKCFSRRKRLV